MQAANILWKQKQPMAAGEFPPEHPCMTNRSAFQEFKARGYWANPFPEGDGITLDLKESQSAEHVVKDIEECFGWEVRRGFSYVNPATDFPPYRVRKGGEDGIGAT